MRFGRPDQSAGFDGFVAEHSFERLEGDPQRFHLLTEGLFLFFDEPAHVSARGAVQEGRHVPNGKVDVPESEQQLRLHQLGDEVVTIARSRVRMGGDEDIALGVETEHAGRQSAPLGEFSNGKQPRRLRPLVRDVRLLSH